MLRACCLESCFFPTSITPTLSHSIKMSFESVPILDLAAAQEPTTKSTFLSCLRDALLKVGFFYIRNIGIDDGLIHDVITQGRAFFDLPQEEKMRIQMRNVPSFLGAWMFSAFNGSYGDHPC